MNRYIIAPLLFCCLASVAQADEIQLQDNHPDRYVVVKGDTLWGISGKFLKDPWRWPQVWKMNREQIKNPHLIYPGDVVVLDSSNGDTQLRLLRETITMEPGVRVEPLEKQPIPTIPPSVIAPFLSQPLVVEQDALQDAPSIIAAQEDHVVISPGIKAYVSGIMEGDGLHWQIFRPGNALIDPDTNEKLGTEAIYLGDARITKHGEPATIEITRITQDIYKDDKLVKAPEILMNSFVPRAPESEIRGRIMSAYGGVAELGPNSIITINRGKTDGLEEGHVLAIYRYGETLPPKKSGQRQQVEQTQEPRAYVNLERNEDGSLKRNENGMVIVRMGTSKGAGEPQGLKLPDERIGLAMVFRTFDRVSYALVMQAERPVHVLDVVQTP